MPVIVRSPRAKNDLVEIWDYIAEDSEARADAFILRGLLERCFSAERLDGLFESNAREQYTRNLLFSTACDLLLLTVLKVHPPVHAAYQSRGEGQGFSAALVRETAKDLGEIQDALGVRREAWLPGYEIRIVDGNCLEASEKRLRVHRQYWLPCCWG